MKGNILPRANSLGVILWSANAVEANWLARSCGVFHNQKRTILYIHPTSRNTFVFRVLKVEDLASANVAGVLPGCTFVYLSKQRVATAPQATAPGKFAVSHKRLFGKPVYSSHGASLFPETSLLTIPHSSAHLHLRQRMGGKKQCFSYHRPRHILLEYTASTW